MLHWKSSSLSALVLFLSLPFALSAQKVVSKSGDWEIKKFPNYCVASVGFEGDRGLRLSSGKAAFTFGFMGEAVATAPAKLPVTIWWDNNKQAKNTATATKRVNQAEDGGANWLIFTHPGNEPAYAGDFELSKTVTFSYKIGAKTYTETFSIKDGKGAYAKLMKCSGQ